MLSRDMRMTKLPMNIRNSQFQPHFSLPNFSFLLAIVAIVTAMAGKEISKILLLHCSTVNL
jgi:hypothetical protein